MDRRFLILTGIILLIVAAGVTTYRIYNKPHRNIEKEKSDFQLGADVLLNEFSSDEAKSNSKYLNKVIEVNGKVISVDIDQPGNYQIILLDELEGLSAHFDDAYVDEHREHFNKLSPGQEIKLKGTCDGYIMLRGVVLNHCALL